LLPSRAVSSERTTESIAKTPTRRDVSGRQPKINRAPTQRGEGQTLRAPNVAQNVAQCCADRTGEGEPDDIAENPHGNSNIRLSFFFFPRFFIVWDLVLRM
jgi:hypothetical protein